MFSKFFCRIFNLKIGKKTLGGKRLIERQAISSLAMDYLQMGLLYTYTILTLLQFYDKVVRKVTLSFTRYPHFQWYLQS